MEAELRLPPLNALRFFEAAGRLGSFVAAAAELHVTQPAIGRHIKVLEDRLQVRLFERTARGVVLTDVGKRYHAQVSHALSLIAQASLELTSRGRQRRLRLIVVSGFASRWLRRRLPEFRQAHPGLRISIEPNSTFNQLPDKRADLGIAFGAASEFQGGLQLLVTPPIYPVCSPEFLSRVDQPVTLRSLAKLPLLHEDDGGWWSDWFRAQGVRVQLTSELSYSSADDLIDLALTGAGIALINPLLAQEELAAGLLVRPIPNQCFVGSYHLLLPAGNPSPEVQAFCDWLIEAIKV